MKKRNQHSIQIPPIQSNLKSILTKRMKMEDVAVGDCPVGSVVEEMDLCDFGTKFRILVLQAKHEKRIELHVSVPGWKDLKTHASDRLQSIYGDSLTVFGNDDSNGKFDFVIRVDEAARRFENIESFAESLAQIRIQTIGAPFYKALGRIVGEDTEEVFSVEEKVYDVLIQPLCGTCHCFSTREKTLVIFAVDFKDDIERALTRVFLQQFAGAQKQVSQSPHCEFRRGNDPPKEIQNFLAKGCDLSKTVPTGYLSFAFFPSHVKTVERRQKAVELIVNFYCYLDKHVKSTKSYMNIRARAEKDNLLRELRKERRASQGVTQRKHSLLSKDDNSGLGERKRIRDIAIGHWVKA